jgi:hypothetical protein
MKSTSGVIPITNGMSAASAGALSVTLAALAPVTRAGASKLGVC